MTETDLDLVDRSRGPTASQAAGLTLAVARRLIAAAEGEARSMGVAMSVAIVDSGDQLVAFERMDGADLVGIRLAQDKAFTALVNRMATADLAPMVQPGTEFYGLRLGGWRANDRLRRRDASRARRDPGGRGGSQRRQCHRGSARGRGRGASARLGGFPKGSDRGIVCR